MIRSVLLRIAEILAFAWWLFALRATFLFTVHLPYHETAPQQDGCYLTSDWFIHVDCGSSEGSDPLGGVLTWAMLWTKDIDVLISLSAIPVLTPLVLLWLGSVFLAASFLFRLLLKAQHRRST
ncbi:hypothetical protein [Microvirga terrestris]|uniref:Uncharacterized protein n=1 Tax=Microvirga terrestris TaxID=2791024 RepID=A0ABS0HS61_9HYPH|nr:hypothetical protein [Microvirga terrestris]MBF9196309.1 hypothetical protein [Microvirga terrestris]